MNIDKDSFVLKYSFSSETKFWSFLLKNQVNFKFYLPPEIVIPGDLLYLHTL